MGRYYSVFCSLQNNWLSAEYSVSADSKSLGFGRSLQIGWVNFAVDSAGNDNLASRPEGLLLHTSSKLWRAALSGRKTDIFHSKFLALAFVAWVGWEHRRVSQIECSNYRL